MMPVREVLVLDDIPTNLMMMASVLGKLGVYVQVRSSGADALELLTQFRPEMIITDIWMPDMNGAEFAASVHEIPGMERVPIWALTSDTEVEDHFDLEPFAGVLKKPLTRDKLLWLLQNPDLPLPTTDVDVPPAPFTQGGSWENHTLSQIGFPVNGLSSAAE